MSSNATLLLARRSMRARIGRLIAISIAIILGVAFVVGSFVLADSMRSGFDSLFTDAFDNTDLQVRTELAFGRESDTGTRDPVPADLVDTVAAVPGVERAAGELQRSAQIIDAEGEAVTTGGAPMFGASWDGTDPGSTIELREGDAPSGPDQVAIDKNTADHNDLEVGDPIDIITATGVHSFTLTGTVGLGDSDAFGGATFALWDPQTAAEVLGAEGVYDSIDIRVERGCRRGRRQPADRRRAPGQRRGRRPATLIDEANDSVNEFIGPFGTGLLIFAFITAFVSAFLINNVFASHDRSAAARARPAARRRRRREPGPPADRRRGVGDVRHRHRHRHLRRHRCGQVDPRGSSTPPAPDSPTSRSCSRRWPS